MEQILLAVAFPFLFIGMWCAALLLLSRTGGWHRLAQQYPALAPRQGTRFNMQSGKVGWVSYGNCLTVHAAADGIYLAVWPMFRPGHAPLFIPWHAMHNTKVQCFLWLKMVSVDVGEPTVATIQLSKKVFDAARAANEADGGVERGRQEVV